METLALTFGSPLWLWGLLALPVFAALYVWSHLRGRALISKVVAPRLRDQLAGSVSVARRVVRGVFIVLTLGLVLGLIGLVPAGDPPGAGGRVVDQVRLKPAW